MGLLLGSRCSGRIRHATVLDGRGSIRILPSCASTAVHSRSLAQCMAVRGRSWLTSAAFILLASLFKGPSFFTKKSAMVRFIGTSGTKCLDGRGSTRFWARNGRERNGRNTIY